MGTGRGKETLAQYLVEGEAIMSKADKIFSGIGKVCVIALVFYIGTWLAVAFDGTMLTGPRKNTTLADYDRAFVVCRVVSNNWFFPGINFVFDAPVEFCEGE